MQEQNAQIGIPSSGNTGVSLSSMYRLRLPQLLCDQLEWLSDDSDEGRDTKYNILDETDMIEEEDEGAEDDEDDGCDDYGSEAAAAGVLTQ